jgi:sugar phosphate isomerase/epimerase
VDKYKLGLQLYTLKDMCTESLPNTLKVVSELGFQGVEFINFHGMGAKDLRGLLADLNLEVSGSYFPLPKLKDNLESIIEYHLQLGCPYLVCATAKPDALFSDRELMRGLVQDLTAIGDRIRQAGIAFGYHNHTAELVEKIDGESGLSVLFRETAGTGLLSTLDTYGLRQGGENEVEFLRSLKGRVHNLHLKDMAEDGFYAVVGSGVLDLDAIFQAGEEAQVKWVIIEQDRYSDVSPLDGVRIGMQNLKNRGFA